MDCVGRGNFVACQQHAEIKRVLQHELGGRPPSRVWERNPGSQRRQNTSQQTVSRTCGRCDLHSRRGRVAPSRTINEIGTILPGTHDHPKLGIRQGHKAQQPIKKNLRSVGRNGLADQVGGLLFVQRDEVQLVEHPQSFGIRDLARNERSRRERAASAWPRQGNVAG